MAIKRRNLFLYLTLACFLGLIAIFIFDGYMGLYDTIYLTAGEREQKIETDVWRGQDTYWSAGVNRGEKVFFRYEVDNRQFSNYATEVKASIWHMQEKMLDVTTQKIDLASFDKNRWNGWWTLPRFCRVTSRPSKVMSIPWSSNAERLSGG